MTGKLIGHLTPFRQPFWREWASSCLVYYSDGSSFDLATAKDLLLGVRPCPLSTLIGRSAAARKISGRRSCVDGSRVASGDLMFGIGRVQSCVRPVGAVIDRWP